MALAKLLDWSQARPPLHQVKAHGYAGVYRYVCSDAAEAGLPGKRLTPGERDAIVHAGLDIGLHGEDNAGAARAGYSRGLEQGRQWADYAHTVLHAPTGMTIVAAIDYDTLGTYPTVVQDYLGGVTDGLQGEYATGVYGSIFVVDGALRAHDAVHAVQTIAWSGRNPDGSPRISSLAHVYQHGGSEFPGTDYNDVLRVPHGTWLQTLGGADMPLTDAEYNEIARRVLAAVTGGETQVTTALLGKRIHENTDGLIARVDTIVRNTDTVEAKLTALAGQVSNVRTDIANLPDAVVDIPALVTALVAALPPDLATQLVTAMATKLKINLTT